MPATLVPTGRPWSIVRAPATTAAPPPRMPIAHNRAPADGRFSTNWGTSPTPIATASAPADATSAPRVVGWRWTRPDSAMNQTPTAR